MADLQDTPSSFLELIKGWEKLRLLYNAILLIPGVIILFLIDQRNIMPSGTSIPSALLFAICANIGFCLGPFTELYIRGIFFRDQPTPWLRALFFIGGALFSFLFMIFVGFGAFFAVPDPHENQPAPPLAPEAHATP